MSANLRLLRRPACGGMRVAASAVLFAFALIQTQGALAAAAAPAPPPADPPVSASVPAEVRPPYEPQLLRLAEIIGALAYLRNLCGDDDGDKWRTKMANLMAAETGASEGERKRLAGAYNKGFHGYALTYRTCTGNAQIVIERYLAEGERLTREVESRFGGG